MSLEQALADNTAALRELAAVMKGGAAEAPKGRKGKDTPAQPAQEQAAQTATPAQTPPATGATGQAASAASGALSAEQSKKIAELITKLANDKGRDAAVGLLAEFGASNAKQLKAEQVEAFLKRGKELSGEGDAAGGLF